jgi:two-component system NtrC family sensor kinase
LSRDWVTGRAVIDRTTIHVVDLQAPDSGFSQGSAFARQYGHRTTLAVPLLREGSAMGAILIRRMEVKPFTDRQIELVSSFASQAVIAIENARLFNELRESLQQQTATAEVLKVISRSAFDLQPVFNTIVQTASRLCEAEFALIYELHVDRYEIVAANNAAEAFVKHAVDNPIPLGQGSLVGRTALERKPIHIPDCLADPGYSAVGYQAVGQYRTMLGIPLLREGVPIGVIGMMRTAVRPFSDKQIELVATFADQAVIAIQNAQLFEQVQERTKELSQSLDELRTAQDRLVQTEKLASLGQLTAGIAHEIKNPLNFVNNFAALSAELTDELNDVLKPATLDNRVREEVDELTGTLKDNLEKVVQHGRRADSIVKNMLQHSREGSGEQRPADINSIVEESLNLAYHGGRAEKAGVSIALQRDLDPSAGMADVYPQEITRVLLNLISNGFYATAKRKAEAGDGFEPVLSATTRNLGDKVEIRIRDNGTGIPEEVRKKIFNPFFTTKPAGEGTGLGLSMSHDIIVKQHGGSIDLETRSGLFTEFRIVLPRISKK